jgi:hypothetical protein
MFRENASRLQGHGHLRGQRLDLHVRHRRRRDHLRSLRDQRREAFGDVDAVTTVGASSPLRSLRPTPNAGRRRPLRLITLKALDQRSRLGTGADDRDGVKRRVAKRCSHADSPSWRALFLLTLRHLAELC